MSKIKNGGLDQYGAGPSEQQQFGTDGVEGVKSGYEYYNWLFLLLYFLEQRKIKLTDRNHLWQEMHVNNRICLFYH